jgi:hypothetical protein
MEKIRKILVTIGGIVSLLWGLFHISFWFSPLFDWTNELPKLNQLNSNVMQMLNIAVIVPLLSIGVVILVCRKDILETKLGRGLLIVLALFWIARLIGEFAFPEGSAGLGVALFICVLIYLIPAVITNKR